MVEEFRAFFSYAHHDKITDPELLDALTTALENHVNAKLLNARFCIWRDSELRMGQIWNEKIITEIRQSDIFILLLSPQWLQSEWCRREYLLFEQEEKGRSVSGYVPEYVAPIFIRPIEGRETRLRPEQAEVYARIKNRQYVRVSGVNFLEANDAQRRAFIDSIADDIEGMIERRRALKDKVTSPAPTPNKNPSAKKVFENEAFDYEKVDFIRTAELLIDPPSSGKPRRIYAQIDFIERLYVQATNAQIDFGVRRAFFSIYNNGMGNLSRLDDFRSEKSSTRYVILHEHPNAISVVMHPHEGKSTLAELALPPAKGENYLSVVGLASSDVVADNVEGELAVYLEADSLQIAGHEGRSPSSALQRKILAIMEVAVRKDESVRKSRKFRRVIEVRQRADQ